MRIAIGLLCLTSLGNVSLAQVPNQLQSITVLVRTLTIVSNELPEGERLQIVHNYQGGTYQPDELAERIRQKLRDLGYANANVDEPQLSAIRDKTAPRSADVTIQVTPGTKYHIGEIRFMGATVFPPDELRRQFPIGTGALFNATIIGKGLDNLRKLYVSAGYADIGFIPKLEYDEVSHTVALTLDLDEGIQYSFGRLFFDGIEPCAGAAQALLAAWKQLEGKVYNPQALAQWVSVNAPYLTGNETTPENYETPHRNHDARRVDIVLQFPDTASQPP
jgi:outer membrane protein insertion porin family